MTGAVNVDTYIMDKYCGFNAIYVKLNLCLKYETKMSFDNNYIYSLLVQYFKCRHKLLSVCMGIDIFILLWFWL